MPAGMKTKRGNLTPKAFPGRPPAEVPAAEAEPPEPEPDEQPPRVLGDTVASRARRLKRGRKDGT